MPTWDAQMQDIVNYQNLAIEEHDENPKNTLITEYEGQHTVVRPSLTALDVTNTLNIRQVNIGSKEQPKLVNIVDNWDDDTIGKFSELLTGYQD